DPGLPHLLRGGAGAVPVRAQADDLRYGAAHPDGHRARLGQPLASDSVCWNRALLPVRPRESGDPACEAPIRKPGCPPEPVLGPAGGRTRVRARTERALQSEWIRV